MSFVNYSKPWSQVGILLNWKRFSKKGSCINTLGKVVSFHQHYIIIGGLNRRFIRSKNRENLKYKLAPNNFADMTEEEIDLHRGLLHDKKEKKNPKLSEVLYFNQSLLTSGLVPDELDWRDYGKRLSSHILY